MYHEIRTQLDKIKMTEEMKGRIWESLCREETGKCRGRGFHFYRVRIFGRFDGFV